MKKLGNVDKVKNIKNNTKVKFTANLTGRAPIDSLNLIILVILGIIPLIMHLKVGTLVEPNLDPLVHLNSGSISDFVSYYKLITMLVCTFILIILFSITTLNKNNSFKKDVNINKYILAFVISLVISMLLSDYKTIAILGNQKRHVGLLAFLALSGIFFVIVNSKYNKSIFEKLFLALIPLTIVNSVLGILNYFHVNILSYKYIQSLLMGSITNRSFREGSYLIGTENHYNYTSGLGAMLFAIFVGKALFRSDSKTSKLFYLLLAYIASTIVYSSHALSGLVTWLFIVTFLAVVLIEQRSKESLLYFSALLGVTAFTGILLSITNPATIREISTNVSIIALFFLISIIVSLLYLALQRRSFFTIKRILIIALIVIVFLSSVGIAFSDQIMQKTAEEMAKMDSAKILNNIQSDEFALPSYDWAAGTGRLYIWKETLELITAKPFFGYGLDTISFTFDQADPAKISSLHSPNTVVDKPHNLYLNILYGSGLLGFFSYILIIFTVLFRAFKMIFKQKDNYYFQWPLVLGILAYLFQGLFNDPVLGPEIIFWVFLGYSYLLSNIETILEDTK